MQEINRSRYSDYLLHVQIVFVTKYLNECALNFCGLVKSVNIIILTFTDANYGDRHNIIVDTVNQSVACATELYLCIGLCVHVVAMRAPVVQQALSEASF